MNEDKHNDLVKKITKLSQMYSDIEEYLGNLSENLSDIDMYLSDLLHYVEINDFTPSQALKFVNLLKKARKERRKIKDDLVIRDEFNNKKARFDVYSQRNMFLTDIYKKEKILKEEYKPRKINFVEIDNIIKCKSKKCAGNLEKEQNLQIENLECEGDDLINV